MKLWRFYFARNRTVTWVISDWNDPGYRRARRILPCVYWLGPSEPLLSAIIDKEGSRNVL